MSAQREDMASVRRSIFVYVGESHRCLVVAGGWAQGGKGIEHLGASLGWGGEGSIHRSDHVPSAAMLPLMGSS